MALDTPVYSFDLLPRDGFLVIINQKELKRGETVVKMDDSDRCAKV